MSLTVGPLSFMQNLLGTSLGRIVEAPGAWLTNFVDNAEEICGVRPAAQRRRRLMAHVVRTVPRTIPHLSPVSKEIHV